MNVKQLKKLLEDVADDVQILTPSSDHSYVTTRAVVTTVMYDKSYGVYTEDHGEKYTPDGGEYGKRIQAVVIE